MILEIAIVAGAVLLVGWIIHTLVSTAKKSGESESKVDQALESQKRLKNATDAGIAARNDVFGGLRDRDSNSRD